MATFLLLTAPAVVVVFVGKVGLTLLSFAALNRLPLFVAADIDVDVTVSAVSFNLEASRLIL